MGLLTANVGSLPKPPALRRARRQHAEGDIEDAALRTVETAARDEAIEMQEALGLDLLTDGQMDRADMVAFFGDRLQGFEEGLLVRCFGNRYYRKPRIVDEVGREGPITVEAWKAAQARTSTPLKAVLTGPYTLMDWSFDEHYPSRDKCCLALAEAIRAEAEDLLAAGAREIQIDEPAIGSRPEEMDLVAEAAARVINPLVGKARSWIRISYGDYAPVMPAILALPSDGLMLELANSGYAVLDALSGLPGEKILAAGVVDAVSEEVESVDEIRKRVEALVKVVPAERLCLIPDAGLGGLSAESARAKLEALAQAAGSF